MICALKTLTEASGDIKDITAWYKVNSYEKSIREIGSEGFEGNNFVRNVWYFISLLLFFFQ